MARMAVLTGVLGSVAMVAVLAVALRYVFGTGRDLLVPDAGDPTSDGLLVEVTRVPTEAAAMVLRGQLAAGGVRATVSPHVEGGYRLLVFPADEVTAKLLLP